MIGRRRRGAEGTSVLRVRLIASILVAALLPFLSGVIWIGATSFMRASTEVYVFSIVVLMSSRIRIGRRTAARSPRR